jgi:hypothetical protein
MTPQAVINEDTNGDAALLRLENRRLRQELALARGLIATGSEGGTEGQAAAAEQLEQQHAQLQQALGLLSELGKRNGDLEDALEYSKRWGCWSNMVNLGQTWLLLLLTPEALVVCTAVQERPALAALCTAGRLVKAW